MQLSKSLSISAALSAATCSLLGHAAEKTWDVDTTALLYTERDRVTVNEDVVRAKIDMGNERQLTVTGIIDVMTGASPTGASKLGVGQSFTSPSGGKFQTDANQTPVAEFSDRRFAVHGAYERPWSANARATYGADYSQETDYSSLGASFSLVGDFFEKMTSLTIGTSGNWDTVSPATGVPMGLNQVDDRKANVGSQPKVGLQGMVGITQVLSRRALLQVNYTLASQSGYLNDPYKMVSYGNEPNNSLGNHYFENRPSSRTSHVLYWKINWAHDNGDFSSLANRYYYDSWRVFASMTEFKYEAPLAARSEMLGAHLRFSRQSAAWFYHYQLTDNASSPDYVGYPLAFADNNPLRQDKIVYVSADYRLANLDTVTAGGNYRQPVTWFDTKMLLDARVEYLAQFDRAQKVDPLYAVIFQVALRFRY